MKKFISILSWIAPVFALAQNCSITPELRLNGSPCPGTSLSYKAGARVYQASWKWKDSLKYAVLNTTYAAEGAEIAKDVDAAAVSVDRFGALYVLDALHSRVIKYSPGSQTGFLVAGDGTKGDDAYHLNNPAGICVDTSGALYVADAGNARVIKFLPDSNKGIVVAGKTGESGADLFHLNNPAGVCVDSRNALYVCDRQNNRVLKYDSGSAVPTVVAGGIPGTLSAASAALNGPSGIAIDAAGNLYVCDLNNRVLKYAPGASSAEVVAGKDNRPGVDDFSGIFTDVAGNIFVASYQYNRILEFTPPSAFGVSVAGGADGGPGADLKRLNGPRGVFIDKNGALYVADLLNRRVMMYAAIPPPDTLRPLEDGIFSVEITTLDGCILKSKSVEIFPAPKISLSGGAYLCAGTVQLTASGGAAYAWSSNAAGASGATVTVRSPGTYSVTATDARQCTAAAAQTVLTGPAKPALAHTTPDCVGSRFTVRSEGAISRIAWLKNNAPVAYAVSDSVSPADVDLFGGYAAGSVAISSPASVAVDASGNMYVADIYRNRVVKISAAARISSVVAGDAAGVSGSDAFHLSAPNKVITDENGNLYVSDAGNNRILKYSPGSKEGVLIAGTSGVSGSDNFHLNYPKGLCLDAAHNLYVADQNNHRIVKYAPAAASGVTVAGQTGATGSDLSHLNAPAGICIDAQGALYVADYGNQRILKFLPGATAGIVVAGVTGIAGADAAHLSGPASVSLDLAGSLYAADVNNQRVMKYRAGSLVGIVAAGLSASGSFLNLTNVQDITVDSLGALYAADENSGFVYRFRAVPAAPNFQAAAPGVYTAKVFTSEGCAVVSDSVPIFQNSTTAIVGLDTVFCTKDSSVRLASTPANGVFLIDGFSASQFNPALLSAGVHEVRCAAVDIHQCVGTAVQSVSVKTTPAFSLTAAPSASFCAGGNATLIGSAAGTYKWSNGQSASTIVVTSAGKYSVSFTAENGCKTSADQTVRVFPSPNALILGPTILCKGEQARLQAVGGVSFKWSTGDTTASITSSAAGDYSVLVADTNQCKALIATTLTIPPPIAVAIAPTGDVCQGDPYQLQASGGALYKWSTGETAAAITRSGPGSFNVTVTDRFGCMDSASLAVVPKPKPVISIGGTENICAGSGILTVSGGGRIKWSTGDTLPLIVVNAPGLYSVVVTKDGCSAAATKTILAPAPPVAVIKELYKAVCQGDTSSLLASGGMRYLWSTGDTTAAIKITDGGVFKATVTDANGCSATASRALTVIPKPVSTIPAGIFSICPSDGQATLKVNGGYTYKWSTGDTTASIIVKKEGKYSATIVGASGCTAVLTDSVRKDSGVRVAWAAGVIYNKVNFINQSRQAASFSWSLGDSAKTVSSDSAFSFYYPKTGKYTAQLYGVSAGGCKDSLSKTISIDSLLIGGPDAWPGDADANGVVNHIDLLSIGLAYGSAGLQRDSLKRDARWYAHSANPWGAHNPDGVDHLHADSDGDGFVDLNDIGAILQNWNLTHQLRPAEQPVAVRAATPSLFVQPANLTPGMNALIPVVFGDTANTASDVFGLAFSIHYDKNLVSPGSVYLTFDNSWLALNNPVSVYKDFPADGRIDVALCRDDRQNVSGAGQIAQLHFKVKPTARNSDSIFVFSIDAPTVIDAAQHYLNISTPVSRAVLTTTATSEPDISGEISVYPNPASAQWNIIENGGSPIRKVELTDVLGRIILSLTPASGSVLIPAQKLGAGAYFLTVKTDQGVAVKKLLKS